MNGIQRRKRPFVLAVIAVILSGQAVILPILFFIFVFSPSNSPITYNGEQVLMGQVRFEVVGTIMIWFAIAAYVGPGLWKGNPMARHVAFGTYAGLPLIFIIVQQAWAEIPWLIFCCAIVGWYLYVKPNVRGFFET
ncbi:MAG: hypothetical protein DRR42_18675 [Gammaproteobacteria bacterium]|nr:MAG: hypothetical protein DRR42_18675 [Gammaproteobacteria bacterium]